MEFSFAIEEFSAVFKTGSEGIVKPTGACYNYKGRFKKSDVHGQRRTCPAAVQEG